jgi:hypothetical protein
VAQLTIRREWANGESLTLAAEFDETARPEAVATGRLNLLEAYREALAVTTEAEADEASGD